MKALICRGVALGLLACTVPADAQLRAIEAGVEGWRHSGSGAIFPVGIGDLRRTAIRDTRAKELDVITGYKRPDERDELTFYLFKTQIVSAPLWFDRALDAVMLRPGLTAGSARPDPMTFEPQPGRGMVGLRASLPISFGTYRSSAIAVLPVGPWLLKVRLSSADPDLERLDALMTTAIASLSLPVPANEPAAKAIAACPDLLSFAPFKLAKTEKDTSAQILAASLVGAVPGAPKTYCRDRPGTAQLGVYRADGARDGYLAAISDAGRALKIEPGFQLGKGRPGYSFSALELGRTLVFRPLSAIPDPDAALAHVMREQPVAMSEFADGEVNTTILSDAFK